jgi:hypothetical protein
MNAIISTAAHAAEAREAIGGGEVSFEKLGTFDEPSFLQHVMTIATLPIQCLVLDLDSAEEAVFMEGLQTYRQLRPGTKVILLALQRPATDAAVAKLTKSGLEVRTVGAIAAEEPEPEEDGGKLTGAITKLATALNQPALMDSPDALVLDLPQVPMQEKVVVQRKIIGSVIIGVTGVEPRSGSTHLAIMIANYLNGLGKSVGLIEANGSGDYARIEQAYEGIKGYVGQSRSFGIHKTDYYKTVKPSELTSLLAQKYDYILLDIGYSEDAAWLEEFARADLQLVAAAGIDWRQYRNRAFADKHKRMDQSRWIYAVPMSDELTVGDVKKQMAGNEVVRVPYHADPYRSQKDSDSALGQLLKAYIGDKKAAVPKGLIYGSLAASFVVILVLATLLALK